MEALLSKRVQEMVQNGEEPPSPYVCRDVDCTKMEPLTLCSLPIIDFGLLSPSTPTTQQKEELKKLRSSLSSWGCFQVCVLDNFVSINCSFVEITCTEHIL